ncbi:hypothetical protein [Sphingomonas ginsenosidivorax]|uniref:hypothetical protein n=1 Tax=Sphingomonas ginsenosidivorax TaxID=862135 RepID=UPI001F54C62F|nr:hypothetical protein [Sphingomonas ginsenosidivorax]
MGPAIAVKDDIGDGALIDEPAEEFRPLHQRAGIVGRCILPIVSVAAIQVDPMHGMTLGAKSRGKPPEEVAMRPLQESEDLSFDHIQNFTLATT